MPKRYDPPGRKSILQKVSSKPRGPNHCARCSLSVHALKTRLRGASKTRVITSTRSAGAGPVLSPADMTFLLEVAFLDLILCSRWLCPWAVDLRQVVLEPRERQIPTDHRCMELARCVDWEPHFRILAHRAGGSGPAANHL